MFRPMMGWATALSFDVLKRWLEKGESPASQYRRFFLTIFISILFCIVWVYHGLVPKIIVQHPIEVVLVENILEKDLQFELGPSGYRVELSRVGLGPSETELGPSEINSEPSGTEGGPSEFRSRSSETEGESSKIKLNLSKTMAKPNEDALSWNNANQIVIWIGIAEILFGLCWLLPRGKRLLFGAQIIVFPFLTIGALLADITIATAPFNPVTFNLALWVLSIIGFIISKDMPSARRCIRKREETT